MPKKNQNRNSRAQRGKGGRVRSAKQQQYNFSSQSGKGAGTGQMSATTTNTGMVIRNLPLFAERTKRTLSYYSAATVSTGVSAASAYVYSCNGLFDPDISGTGGQPMGFDQMMLFYNHYTVVRSRMRCLITNSSATASVTTGIVLSGSSTVMTSIEQLVENGELVLTQLGTGGQMGSTSKLTRAVNCANFQGIDDIMDDPDMRGDSASNPIEQMYYHVAVYNPYSATVIQTFFQVVIEYEVVFHEPRKGPLS